jgi:hypothetical protein
MLQYILFSGSLAALVLAVWYWGFVHFNRHRSLHILHWLEGAIVEDGQVSGVEWISRSHFRAVGAAPPTFEMGDMAVAPLPGNPYF